MVQELINKMMLYNEKKAFPKIGDALISAYS